MFRFRSPGGRAAVRFRPRLEAFDVRDQPSGFTGEDHDGSSDGIQAPPGNLAPVIVGFTAVTNNGVVVLSGWVMDEAPGGLTVTFGGGVGGISGKSAVTDQNGYFEIALRPTDVGMVTAVVADPWGVWSDEVWDTIDP